MKQADEFRQRTGARLIRCDAPNHDLSAAALGLSLANPLADDTGIDLARTLKPAISIGDVFPYGELLLHGALLGAVSLFSIGAAAEANHRLKAAVGGLKAFSWLKNQDQPKLDAEKKSIQERLKAVGRVPRHARQLVGLAADDRRRHAGKHNHHRARRRRGDRIRIAVRPLQGQEEADRQLRDAAGEKRLLARRSRRISCRFAGRCDAQAAFSADRGFRLSGESGQSGRTSLLASYSVVCLPLVEKGKK